MKSTAASHRSFWLTFRREERKSEETQQRISHCFIPWRTTKEIAKNVPARRRGCAGRAGHTAKHQISGRRRALPRATTSIPSPAFSGTDGYIMRRSTAYNLRYSQKATSVGSSALFSPFLFFFFLLFWVDVDHCFSAIFAPRTLPLTSASAITWRW